MVVLRVAVALLALFAVAKLSLEFQRLLWGPEPLGAIDLKFRYDEVAAWFAGRPAYGETTAVYPPATYPLLWPFLGWLSWPAARVLWACTLLPILAWFGHLLVQGSGARDRLERSFALLLLLSANATGLVVGNGQLTFHLLAPLVAGVLMVLRTDAPRHAWLAAAALFTIGAAKPTLAPPFFVLAMMTGAGWRALLASGGAYVGLTLLGSWFQHESPLVLVRTWLTVSRTITDGVGYGNLHSALHALDLSALAIPASLLALGVQAGWTWMHRRADVWLLLGMAGLTARLWAYHLPYDDVLALLPMISLLRIAWAPSTPRRWRAVAGALVAVLAAVMLLPVRMYYVWPAPWPAIYAAVHTVPWLASLGFFLLWAHRSGR